MALNPTTGVDYDIDTFATINLTTQAILNTNAGKWPRPDGGPLVGPNPTTGFLKRITQTPPTVDHRYTLVTSWQPLLFDPLPDNTVPVGEYRQTHTPELLPLEDLIAQIETQFQDIVRQWVPETENPVSLVLALDALARREQGAVLTSEQQTALDNLVGRGDALQQNMARRDELIAAATANEAYDLTEGWFLPESPE